MKKLLFLLSIITFVGCNSIAIKQVDQRAPTEIALIKEFVNADSAYNAQINDVTKKEIFEKSKVKLTDFIVNKLKGKVENWEVSIFSIEPSPIGIDVTFLISKPADFEEQPYEIYDSIILESQDVNNGRLKEILKTLKPKDKVLITGTIVLEKNIDNTLQFQTLLHASFDNEEALKTPSFNFNLTDIKKK